MASTKMEVQLQLLWAQYEKGLAEAEKATISRTSAIGKVFDRAGKSYSKAIVGGLAGMVGAQSMDAGIRALADGIRELDIERLRNVRDIFESIGSRVEAAVKKVPLIGAFYELGQAMSVTEEDRDIERRRAQIYADMAKAKAEEVRQAERLAEIERARESAMRRFQKTSEDMIVDLNTQRDMLLAGSDEERERIKRQADLNKLIEDMKDQMDAANVPLKQQALMLEHVTKRMSEINRLKDQQRKNEERSRAVEDAEREQKFLEREMASAQSDKIEELRRVQAASNVASLGTAVGAVRVAGAVDYSSERMATNLDRIREIDAKIEDNTRYLRELRAN